jgi:hypothetical protein
MMAAAVDPEKKVLYFNEHAMFMALDEDAYAGIV